MIKKLITIIAMFMAMSAWSEPSDWVAKELIKKPVTYMSIGLHKCNSNFADIKNPNYPVVSCSYNWNANRLEFYQYINDSKLTRKDYGEALSQCKKLISPTLVTFIQYYTDTLISMYLDGFSPDGYKYEGKRDEKFDEFVKRSLVTVVLFTSYSMKGAWQCDWERGDKEPSLKWIPKKQ